MTLENAAPEVKAKSGPRKWTERDEDDDVEDKFDAREIFGL